MEDAPVVTEWSAEREEPWMIAHTRSVSSDLEGRADSSMLSVLCRIAAAQSNSGSLRPQTAPRWLVGSEVKKSARVRHYFVSAPTMNRWRAVIAARNGMEEEMDMGDGRWTMDDGADTTCRDGRTWRYFEVSQGTCTSIGLKYQLQVPDPSSVCTDGTQIASMHGFTSLLLRRRQVFGSLHVRLGLRQ